ncbi:hypothetical protein FY534_12800 [Alicyclobacillus sp. TC]|uniref:Big-1 domain-containing protein n=1 Tax=Alicyclobacillus tolerans TaxID=90970 RepID=A0ABT9LTX8_9BACL|nr:MULTISPECIES: hypothetical protein [Alicyclobacillus]MDP9727722.1 hypothetical protein [Alicyclobacillus tengchongensis]QRF24407.1 hypothetical protein FY534_12800 [Alicyclobacillus sp. TC]
MKRALTGIAAASVVLGMSVPTVFAANYSNATWHQETIQIGSTTLGFKGFDALYAGTQTDYMPIYYLIEMLQKDGYQASWNGINKVFSITTPSGVKVDMSQFTNAGQGTASIYLNGQLVQMTDSVVMKDPASGVNTTYMPVYFLLKVLSAIGAASQSNWDGNTETLTLQAPTPASTNASLSAIMVSGAASGTGAETAPAINTNGTSETLSTTLTDASGNPVSGASLTLTLLGANQPVVQQGGNYLAGTNVTGGWTYNVTTNSNGVATVSVTGNGAYTATFTAQYTVNGSQLSQTAYLGFVSSSSTPLVSPASPYSATTSSVSNPSVGVVPVTVTLPPNSNGTAQSGVNVTFTLSTSSGAFLSTSSGQSLGTNQITVTTNSNGQATAYLNSFSANGTATVQITASGFTIPNEVVNWTPASSTVSSSVTGIGVYALQNLVPSTTPSTIPNSVTGIPGNADAYFVPFTSTSNAMTAGDAAGTYNLSLTNGATFTSVAGLPVPAVLSGMSNLQVVLTENTATNGDFAGYTVTADGIDIGNVTSSLNDIAVEVAQSTAAGAANNTTLTVNSGSMSATAGYEFTSGTQSYAANFSPVEATLTDGASQTFTYTVEDSMGDPVPNAPTTLTYDNTAPSGSWLTAVNGTTLSQGIGTNGQTEPTPIPLYSFTGTLGYKSVFIPGVVDFSSAGTVTVYSNANGQVSITLQNGEVPYYNGNVVASSGTGTTTGATYVWTYQGNSQATSTGSIYFDGNSTAPTTFFNNGSPTQIGQINY